MVLWYFAGQSVVPFQHFRTNQVPSGGFFSTADEISQGKYVRFAFRT